jgi:pantoate--beta-alanine ligase
VNNVVFISFYLTPIVRRSIEVNDATVVSIFVNPAQFAPYEDLGTYPKTFDADMSRLRDVLAESTSRTPTSEVVVFLPPVRDMYPSGITLNIDDQKGTFVEVKGFGHQMEGIARPNFFRGVATVRSHHLLRLMRSYRTAQFRRLSPSYSTRCRYDVRLR